MARNKVMKLWTAIVTAFLALCTALGFVTTTASAAVPHTETHSNTEAAPEPADPAAAAPWTWSRAGALPPTMKQRIHAEAHGKAPSCRHRPVADAASTVTTLPCDTTESPAQQHTVPLQR
ncbi:DUF6344 domain-containing protein [Streptomyces sp. SID5910]|uniref:DUF6344 domain-containing protein n=1 Tax=Streptomyces sp. SID5910 TaxID=2690312 RepID=UPI00136B8905|nr:DUF6344 domain-containing protein [Streptomyces sp. SID5910]MYR41206.1 hypothetical protein [Streptomyces sp. SID5910]